MKHVTVGERKLRVLYSKQEIAQRVGEIAGEIKSAQMERLLVVPILKGSFIFAADLVRALHEKGMAPTIEFLSLSSYREATVSSGQVEILRDVEGEVEGRSVLLLDDILESGRTTAFAKDLMVARGALQVKTCVLLDKPGKRAVDLTADFVGFKCPDYFVVGYGMDMAHNYRQLPFVGVIEEI